MWTQWQAGRCRANPDYATEFSVAQLKIMAEVITLAVFVPFAVYYMNSPCLAGLGRVGLCLLPSIS